MKIQINKAPPVVQPPDTFTLTGTLEELSAIKTFADYYASERQRDSPSSRAAHRGAAAQRLADSIIQVGIYRWSDSSKLFLPE